LDAIIATAVEDRYESKKVVKQLQDHRGSHLQQRARYLWSERFKTFRNESLQAECETLLLPSLLKIRQLRRRQSGVLHLLTSTYSPLVAPTGEQLERFFTAIIRKIVPRKATGVPAYHTFTNALIELIQW